MLVTGIIEKINNELNYGFIKCPKMEKVFFSLETSFSGTTFENLKVNQKVEVEVFTTERGLFAQSLTLAKQKTTAKSPEVSI